MSAGYDVECHRLAEHFLADEPCRADPERYRNYCVDLAQAIQDVVERWFMIDYDEEEVEEVDEDDEEDAG